MQILQRLLMAEPVGLSYLFVGDVTASHVTNLASRLLAERGQLTEQLVTRRERTANNYRSLISGALG